ncbi:hypothetical protein K788_0005791 [Paraburkholderia caribensis MBA4]|uniref:Uncharacterized protein n=1 Tax=Paraburkholderia caribensis MBA4 TaxID=1323664 RepID=A0A0P0RE57_9BURK|nr:hypothetical protein K788_0005791 [Paraburkholderia caribensis MBA4]
MYAAQAHGDIAAFMTRIYKKLKNDGVHAGEPSKDHIVLP